MKTTSPYLDHVFVCNGERCRQLAPQDEEGQSETKNFLKSKIKELGLKGSVRVTQSGCLGICETAPNIMCYPRQDCYTQVEEKDLAGILADIQAQVSK